MEFVKHTHIPPPPKPSIFLRHYNIIHPHAHNQQFVSIWTEEGINDFKCLSLQAEVCFGIRDRCFDHLERPSEQTIKSSQKPGLTRTTWLSISLNCFLTCKRQFPDLLVICKWGVRNQIGHFLWASLFSFSLFFFFFGIGHRVWVSPLSRYLTF